jgi:hypothetical protein
MKNRFSLWVICLLFTSVFLLPAAHAQCTNATLAGPWGYSIIGGMIPAPGSPASPGTALEQALSTTFGVFVADGAGHIADSNSTISFFFFPSVPTGTDSGTYTVNANCTGTITFHLTSLVVHFDFVLDSSATQMYLICSDPTAIASGAAKFI